MKTDQDSLRQHAVILSGEFRSDESEFADELNGRFTHRGRLIKKPTVNADLHVSLHRPTSLHCQSADQWHKHQTCQPNDHHSNITSETPSSIELTATECRCIEPICSYKTAGRLYLTLRSVLFGNRQTQGGRTCSRYQHNFKPRYSTWRRLNSSNKHPKGSSLTS